MKQLTNDEWVAIKPPFTWMRIKKLESIEHQFLEKWLDENTSGWWYCDSSTDTYTYIFEVPADMVLFKIWASSDPFKNDSGEIT